LVGDIAAVGQDVAVEGDRLVGRSLVMGDNPGRAILGPVVVGAWIQVVVLRTSNGNGENWSTAVAGFGIHVLVQHASGIDVVVALQEKVNVVFPDDRHQRIAKVVVVSTLGAGEDRFVDGHYRPFLGVV